MLRRLPPRLCGSAETGAAGYFTARTSASLHIKPVGSAENQGLLYAKTRRKKLYKGKGSNTLNAEQQMEIRSLKEAAALCFGRADGRICYGDEAAGDSLEELLE